MNNQQLYINDVAVDMPSESIKIKVASNLLADVDKVMTAHSYSIHLPRTMTNDNVFALAYVAGADTGNISTHCYLKASLYIDGIPLFEGGKAVLNEVDDDGYNLNLYWGLIDVFDEIKREGLQLCDLPLSSHWNEQTMATWGTLTKWYLGDNPPVYNGNMNDAIYATLDDDSKAEADTKPWTMPFVFASSIMSKISAVYGLTFDYSTEFQNRMANLVHPLTTLKTICKGEKLTFEIGAQWIYGSDGKKYLTLSIPRNANNGRFLQNAVEVVTNDVGMVDIYSRMKINVKSIKVSNATCDLRWFAEVYYASDRALFATQNAQTGYWEMSHEWNDVVCETRYPILSIGTELPWASSDTPDFTINFEIEIDEIGDVPIGNNYCYERNYPDLKVMDYISELLAHCGGCIVGKTTKQTSLRITTLDEVMSANSANYDCYGVRSITMSLDDLARRNIYSHKNNDDETGGGLPDYDASGMIVTNDETLELEREAYKSSLKVPRQNLIKLWKVEKKDDSNKYKATWNNAGNYIAGYITTSVKVANTGQDFQSIIDAYYTNYSQLVYRPKAVELDIRLNALDLINFSFEHPIYIPQLAKSYIATSIESDKDEQYKLKLIQI
jgi:hypothetical protein